MLSQVKVFKFSLKICIGIPKEQGIAALWRGNGANIVRIIPMTAIKFPSYDTYKRISMPRGEWGYTVLFLYIYRLNSSL